MKLNAHAIFSLLLPSFAVISSAKTIPAGAVERIGFSKRQDQWIGGASLYATGCPANLQNCGTNEAQNWCCPKDTVCRSSYCCPNSERCDGVVRSFPSCADPSWTLCTFDYYGDPGYYCCQAGEQCFLAVGSAPACGPANLPVQSTQKLSTVSPMYTAGSSLGPGVSTGSSVSSQSSLSSSYSSSVLVSNSKSQVTPSITRLSGSGIPTPGSSGTPTAAAAAGSSQTAAGSGNNSTPGSTSGSSGLSSGAIGGIVVGAIAGLALIVLAGIFGVRYGSKKAIESYVATASATNTTQAYNAPENTLGYKPEVVSQVNVAAGYGPPAEHVELGVDNNRN